MYFSYGKYGWFSKRMIEKNFGVPECLKPIWFSSLQRETLRLCRRGSKSLRDPGVHRKLPVVSRQAHERESHDGRCRKPKLYEMRVQISCSVHSEVSKKINICGIVKVFGWSISKVGRAKGKPDWRKASLAWSCSHVDFNPPKIPGIAGNRVYQRKKHDSSFMGIWTTKEKFCGAPLPGMQIFCIRSRSRWTGNSRAHQQARRRGQAFRSIESMA